MCGVGGHIRPAIADSSSLPKLPWTLLGATAFCFVFVYVRHAVLGQDRGHGMLSY
jgi:hypothetical protein